MGKPTCWPINVADSPGDQEPIPISLVVHAVFCARRAWLEASGEKVDSAQMELGLSAHRRVDELSESRPLTQRAVDIHHEGLNLVGRCDLVRGDPIDGVEIVEYKASPVRRRPDVTPGLTVQLMLQRMALESMGIRVRRQGVYFTNHHTLVDVEATPALEEEAADQVLRTRQIISSPTAPPPLVDDARCRGCSHPAVCLPDELRLVTPPARSISVSDPDGEILHLLTPGARASIRDGRLNVVKGDETLSSLPFERVRGLVVYGNVDVSSAVIREMLWRHLTIVWCSGRGRVTGWTRSADSPNGQARIRQHVLAESGCLQLANEFIATKVANQATQLRRNCHGATSEVKQMRRIQSLVSGASSLPELFAYEGEAAAIYFGALPQMVRGPGRALLSDWTGRHGRHAQDPINAALNFAYGMLLSDTVRAIAACGLDPSAGFAHSSSRNKPALALDLMEEFRTPVAESTVVGAINTGELAPKMFHYALGDARLTESGRRAIVAAYERRIQKAILHPVFGYRVSWRRAIEVQARLILGRLDGSQSRYTGMRTR